MRKSLSNKLYLRFPELFKGRNKPMTESLMCFEFDCGDGWYDLIYEVCERIEQQAAIDNVPVPEAVQVKQKLGGLRFYLRTATMPMLDIIEEAETQSESTCEICGDHGERFSYRGYIKTRCDKHRRF